VDAPNDSSASRETGDKMTSVWMVFLGLAGMAAVALFVSAVRRWPVIAAISIVVNVAIAWEMPYPPALVNVGGASVYFLDILAVATLLIALSRLPSLVRNLGAAFWPWIGLGVLLLVSLGVGLFQNPFGTTVNEFRSFFHPYAAMTWAMSCVWNRELTKSLIHRFSLVLGWSLTVVAGYHFALHGLGSTSAVVDAGTGLEQTTRPLVSGQALMILLCGMVCIWSWRRLRHNSLLISAVTFFAVVTISQQRSVWAVGMVSLVVVFVAARSGTKTLVALFGAVTVWVVAVMVATQSMPQVLTQLTAAAEDSGTYDARLRSWTNLIGSSVLKGPLSIIFGQPMGGGFGRFEGVGRWVEFAPHNWYVTIYLRTGVVGLLLLVAFLVLVFVRILSHRSNMAGIAMVIAITVYGWSYSWPWYVGLFFGWAIVRSTSEIAVFKQTNRKITDSGLVSHGESKQIERQ
jgi:hypothetical protein